MLNEVLKLLQKFDTTFFETLCILMHVISHGCIWRWLKVFCWFLCDKSFRRVM